MNQHPRDSLLSPCASLLPSPPAWLLCSGEGVQATGPLLTPAFMCPLRGSQACTGLVGDGAGHREVVLTVGGATGGQEDLQGIAVAFLERVSQTSRLWGDGKSGRPSERRWCPTWA